VGRLHSVCWDVAGLREKAKLFPSAQHKTYRMVAKFSHHVLVTL
jgi:hypothetical protein